LNKLSQNVRTEKTLCGRDSRYSKQKAPADASVAAYLSVKEDRMDGATMESASADESSDEDGLCRENRSPTRLRNEGAFAEDASLDGGGSSEGSMPASSYQKRNK